MRLQLRGPTGLLGVLAVLWLLFPAIALSHQETSAGAGQPQDPALERPTTEELEAAVQALETSAGLSAEQSAKAREALSQTQALLRSAELLREEAADLERRALRARDDAEAIRQELAQPAPEPEVKVPQDADLRRVESLRDEAVSVAAGASAQVEDLQGERARRESRLRELPAQIAAAEKRLSEAREELGSSSPEEQDSAVAGAQRLLARARVESAQVELAKLTSERSSYQARSELLVLRIDQAMRASNRADALAEQWREQARIARRVQAEREAREARQRAELEATRRWPTLAEVAEQTARLTAERSGDGGVLERIEQSSEERKHLAVELKRVTTAFEKAYGSLEVAGETYTMGLLLRREFENLPDLQTLARAEKARRRQIADVEYRRILLRERRGQVADVGERVKRFRLEVEQDPVALAADEAQRRSLEETATQLFTAQRDLLFDLGSEYGSYSQLLAAMQADSQALRAITGEFEAFISERVLWIRSISPAERFVFSGSGEALRWLIGWHPEAQAAPQLGGLLRAQRVPLAGLLVLGAGLFLLAKRCRRRLDRLAHSVASFRTDSYWHTLEAVLLTFGVALPLPILLALLVAIGSADVETGTWLGAWLQALASVVPFLLALLVLRAAARPAGLAEAHFRWRKDALASLRRELGWYIPVALLATVAGGALQFQENAVWSDSLGRILFILRAALLATLTGRLFRPRGPVLAGYYERNPDGILYRFRYLVALVAVVLPANAGVFALFGFFYSAQQEREAYAWTMLYVLVLLLAHNLALRWLFMARRRLAVKQALEAKADREDQAAREQEGVQAEPAIDVERVDIPAMDAQAKTLFRACVATAFLLGMLSIWSGIIPSLRYLDRLQLYPTLTVLQERADEQPGPAVGQALPREESSSADGGALRPQPPTQPSPVAASRRAATNQSSRTDSTRLSLTVADLGRGLLLLVLTILAARNIPGLLEFTLLRRLPLDTGARYATITLTRWAIGTTGMILALGAVHITWDSVKWLAAALTFGLAFGLQEIFANFISGLIVLLERPIRVGDTVTVGATTGTVSRIHMRATTILDWNSRELLIPNKNLITNELVNWTLSSALRRVDFPVGIAYGSDTGKARALLETAAAQSPYVLDDPRPYALFKGFGASSLEFELRVYIPSGAVWVDLMNDVHTRVDELFRAEGIEIAFPQVDLHLRSAEAALRVGLQPTGEGPASSSGAGR